jgi:hypothetical protein
VFLVPWHSDCSSLFHLFQYEIIFVWCRSSWKPKWTLSIFVVRTCFNTKFYQNPPIGFRVETCRLADTYTRSSLCTFSLCRLCKESMFPQKVILRKLTITCSSNRCIRSEGILNTHVLNGLEASDIWFYY